MDLSKNGYYSPTKGSVTLGIMLDEITGFVNENKKSFYRLVIGTDSQIKHEKGGSQCDFVTAIVVYRKGNGARYFWRRDKVFSAPHLRDKIYRETQISLEAASELVPIFSEYLIGTNYDFEIHIDVGEIGATREMLKEVVGMVSGSGYVAKTKPESWGASSVADKHT